MSLANGELGNAAGYGGEVSIAVAEETGGWLPDLGALIRKS